MIAALIPAAGEGRRLGQGPKALVEIAGKSLLERAVEAFESQVDETLVAVPTALCRELASRLGARIGVVAGGRTRQESVHRLLEKAAADIVLVHDAARPFLSARLIEAVIAETARSGAASLATPVADTLVETPSGVVVDRQRLRAVQTPQGFKRQLLLEAHRRALAEGVAVSDDAALVRRLGHPVALVEGSSWLMKITTPADFEIAQALAARWDAHDR